MLQHPSPEIRQQIKNNVRKYKAHCKKYGPYLNSLLDQVFIHGPIEDEKVDFRAVKHPEFYDMLESFQHNGAKFWDLSGQGRYHMTGEHKAIDEKPWRPL